MRGTSRAEDSLFLFAFTSGFLAALGMTAKLIFPQPLELPAHQQKITRTLKPVLLHVVESMLKRNREPCPTALSTQMRPPCASTICRAMDRPRPVPPASRDLAASTR